MPMIMCAHILLPLLLLISMLPSDIYMIFIYLSFHIVNEIFAQTIRIYGLIMNLINFVSLFLPTFFYYCYLTQDDDLADFKYIITVIYIFLSY